MCPMDSIQAKPTQAMENPQPWKRIPTKHGTIHYSESQVEWSACELHSTQILVEGYMDVEPNLHHAMQYEIITL
jgi:hypothetical protein